MFIHYILYQSFFRDSQILYPLKNLPRGSGLAKTIAAKAATISNCLYILEIQLDTDSASNPEMM